MVNRKMNTESCEKLLVDEMLISSRISDWILKSKDDFWLKPHGSNHSADWHSFTLNSQ